MAAVRGVDLSVREEEVLAALGGHLSNAQIASRLYISVRTVEGYVSSLLRKFGASDRRELAALAGAVAGGGPVGGVVGVPVARTSFVGRDDERSLIRAAMSQSRLVTLVGPGGVGKTRLAAVVTEDVAASVPLGGAFVDLVPAQPASVPQLVATALGVTEGPQQSLDAAIAGRLSRGRSLLVLDSCEHVIDAAAGLAEQVLSMCPSTTVLATSRERLAVPGERTIPIGPLSPRSDARRLFYERAVAVNPAFEADSDLVADLCGRLDGLPLAIELAAARSGALGGLGLLTGLGDYLRLLTGGRGAAARHRSLRAVIGWSYNLLGTEEQKVFRRLAVFAGGFDLDAVAAIADITPAVAPDVLGALVDKSLVVHDHATYRWRLLETIRAFATDQLRVDGERDATYQRHLEWATAVATSLERGPDASWRGAFDGVAGDLRAALGRRPAGPDANAHALARALGAMTHTRRFLREAKDHFRRAAGFAPTPREAAWDLHSAAECAQAAHDSGDAFDLLLAAAGEARTAGNGDVQAMALARAVELACRYSPTFAVEVPYQRLCRALDEAAAVGDAGNAAVATQLAIAAAWNAGPAKLTPDRALADAAMETARAAGDPRLLSAALDAVRTAAVTAGRVRHAHQVSVERLALLVSLKTGDPWDATEVEDILAVACHDCVAVGDLPTALATAQLILDHDADGGPSYLSLSKVIPATVLAGDVAQAVRYGSAMWDGWLRAGRPPPVWLPAAAHFVSLACGLYGDADGATLWRSRGRDAASRYDVFHARHSPVMVFVSARIALHTGQRGGVAELVDTAFGQPPEARYRTYAVAAAAELAVAARLPDARERLSAAAEDAAADNDWASACLARAEGRLTGDAAGLAASVRQWERLGARFERACTLLLLPDRVDEGRSELAALGLPEPPG